jgi:hypothetical protein
MAITKNGSTATGFADNQWTTTYTSGSFAIATGTNSVLVVSVAIKRGDPGATPVVTGVKWGGSGGTALTSAILNGIGNYDEISIWYLVAPTVQTSTVYISCATEYEQIVFAATVWDGAAQTSTFSGAVGLDSGWGTSFPLTAISSAVGDLVIDSMLAASGMGAMTCGQTQDANVAGAQITLGQSNKAGAASVVMSWSSAAEGWMPQCGASLAAAVTTTNYSLECATDLFAETGTAAVGRAARRISAETA